LLADARAKSFSDWSIVVRDDHLRQWAYQGKPLYRYSGTDPRGEPQGERFQLIENPTWHDPSSNVYSPKQGWRRAAYMPEKTAVLPTSLQLDLLPVGGGFGLVDAATHMTVYTAPASRKLSTDWQPVRAAALAVPVGEFSIITRKVDGSRQWAYRGEALYTYDGDYSPGDANGLFTGDRSIQTALLYRNFMPPGTTIGSYVGRGPLMVTSKGQTLYMVARYHAAYGGREAPGGYTVSYNEIKAQGAVGCQGDCTLSWKPMMAAANAQSSGFWELITRPEGKQWAFKGSPVYTYVGDREPGDTEGNNIHVVFYGGAQGEVVYAKASVGPRDLQPRLGTVDMPDAIGAKPGEKATYVVGEGYALGRAELAALDRPGRARGARAAGAAASGQGDRPNADTAGGAAPAQGGGINRGPAPDHGAGFYWHTVPLFVVGGSSGK
jgi:predicted lipoprotein with Yx(FWY)xxD motif